MRKLAFITMVAALMVTMAVPAFAGPITFGQNLPAMTIKDLEGADISLDSFLGTEEKPGKETLMVFFNTSCSQCQTELNDLKKLSGGPQIIAIGIDMGGPKIVQRYIKNRGYEFTVLSDAEFKVGAALGIGFTPASAYFDKNGKLTKKFFGYKEAQKKGIHDLF